MIGKDTTTTVVELISSTGEIWMDRNLGATQLAASSYGKYAALTALGTYLILNPQKAQASSPADTPGSNF
jgi:hypothetical protein